MNDDSDTRTQQQSTEPFLFQFLESDTRPQDMVGTLSGGPEDPRPPEPSRKTPWGD